VPPPLRPSALFLLAAILAPWGIAAQEALAVPPGDPVYRTLAAASAAGLLEGATGSALPLTRREVARLLSEARESESAMGKGPGEAAVQAAPIWLRDGIAAARVRFPTVEGVPGEGPSPSLLRLSVEVGIMDSPPRPVPEQNGLGAIRMEIDPLTAYRRGLPFRDGAMGSAGAEVAWSPTRRVSLVMEPVAVLARPRGAGGVEAEWHLARGGIHLLAGNLRIRAGRDQVQWGQAGGGGTLLSANVRGWDMLELATDAPVTLPWFLGWLGPSRLSLLVASMGPQEWLPGAHVLAYRGVARPHPRLELGGSMLIQGGGEGAREARWWERLLDWMVFPDLLDASDDFGHSNKLGGWDVRWIPPGAGGMELYGELSLDDFDLRRFRSTVMDNGAFVVGAHLPGPGEGLLPGITAEVTHTGGEVYRHSRYRDGFTLEGRGVGSALGPDAARGLLTLEWPTADGGRLGVDAALEEFRDDRYRVFPEPDFRYERIVRGEREHRVRGVIRWEGGITAGGLELHFLGGVERVRNHNFQEGERRTNLLATAGAVWRP